MSVITQRSGGGLNLLILPLLNYRIIFFTSINALLLKKLKMDLTDGYDPLSIRQQSHNIFSYAKVFMQETP
jgi:hypothetical protein